MSFQQGLSGLNATSKSLEVIGNNIANANTFGAKSSRAEFADMYAASLSGGGSSSAGIGVNLARVAQQFTQGNITATDNTMDLAINGRGFFQLAAADGSTLYSRNGQFQIDRDGFVVSNQGLKLKAQPWDEAAGRADGDPVPVQLRTGLGAAVATGAGDDPALRGVQLKLNLKANDGIKVGVAPAPVINFDDPSTYNFSTSQTLYDGQGASLTMEYFFQKTATNTWDVYATIDGAPLDLPNGTTYDPTTYTVGPALTTLTFDGTGGLLSGGTAALTAIDPRVPPLAANVFSALPVNFGGTTQFASAFSISARTQDGCEAGSLTGITFDSTGIIQAAYSNGRTSNLGRVQLVDFTNVQGLQAQGGNVWAATYASNEPQPGEPGKDTFGSLRPGALEESNIDLTGELVAMITAQRIYQANAQTIKAQDQVMQTLVNLR